MRCRRIREANVLKTVSTVAFAAPDSARQLAVKLLLVCLICAHIQGVQLTDKTGYQPSLQCQKMPARKKPAADGFNW